MINSNEIRSEFAILQKLTKNGKPPIFFNNGATSLKPQRVIDEITRYYTYHPTNVGSGTFDALNETVEKYHNSRKTVAKFINAKSNNEIIFTAGTTNAINIVAHWMEEFFQIGDEIILNKTEHGSNLLPWYQLAKKFKGKIVFAPLEDDHSMSVIGIKKVLTKKTKIITFAASTNTIGDHRDIKAICKLARENNIFSVVDGAQYVGYFKSDVQKFDCDFFLFGTYKIYGPTGTGVLYVRQELMKKLKTLDSGGKMNCGIELNGEFCVDFNNSLRFEPGSPHMAGIIGSNVAIKYLEEIGPENIYRHTTELKKYAVEKLSEMPIEIKIYNKNIAATKVIFNLKGVAASEVEKYLANNGIAVSAGLFCSKLLPDVLKVPGVIRLAFAVYNTKEEIDILCNVLKSFPKK